MLNDILVTAMAASIVIHAHALPSDRTAAPHGPYGPQAQWPNHRAVNRSQGFYTDFESGGIRVGPLTGHAGVSEPWEWRLALVAWGREGAMVPATTAAIHRSGNRVEYRRGDITEWYVNHAHGLEQGFTIDAAPTSGASPLTVELSVGGDVAAHCGADGQQVTLVSPSGSRVINFGALTVVDALGRKLPSWFEVCELSAGEFASGQPTTRLSIVVVDVCAIYPITIDPLATNPFWMIEGEQVDAHYGSAVACAGDVNADGYPDAIVGAPFWDNGHTNEGRAYVYHGSDWGFSQAPNWTKEPNHAGALFGHCVGTAGDVNGDGYDDVINSGHFYDNGQTDEGRAWVYHGSQWGLQATAAWSYESNLADIEFGTCATTAGDVNGDGYSDVVIGAPYYSNGETIEGRIYVFHGSATGLAATPTWTIEGNQASAQFGRAVAGAGDVNGDGFSDVIVGVPSHDTPRSDDGAAFIYFGSVAGLPLTPSCVLYTTQQVSGFGIDVACAGDVNGDGFSDVIVGSGDNFGGRAYVFHGSPTGPSAPHNWVGIGNQSSAYIGEKVASAGDVNGDGFDDVILGAYGYDPPGLQSAGAAFVYLGSASGLGTAPAWSTKGTQVDEWLGISVAAAGDANGDGLDDVIIGARHYTSGQDDEGAAFVFLGTARPCPLDLDGNHIIDGGDLGILLGDWNSDGPGDLNGDDIIDGADLGILLGEWGPCTP